MTAVVRLELLEQIEVVDIGSPGFVYPLWSYVVRPESSSAAGGPSTVVRHEGAVSHLAALRQAPGEISQTGSSTVRLRSTAMSRRRSRLASVFR
jgi:hypothetical protein